MSSANRETPESRGFHREREWNLLGANSRTENHHEANRRRVRDSAESGLGSVAESSGHSAEYFPQNDSLSHQVSEGESRDEDAHSLPQVLPRGEEPQQHLLGRTQRLRAFPSDDRLQRAKENAEDMSGRVPRLVHRLRGQRVQSPTNRRQFGLRLVLQREPLLSKKRTRQLRGKRGLHPGPEHESPLQRDPGTYQLEHDSETIPENLHQNPTIKFLSEPGNSREHANKIIGKTGLANREQAQGEDKRKFDCALVRCVGDVLEPRADFL